MAHRLWPMPGISSSRSGSLSITFNASMPKCATIARAVEGPMPLTMPLPR